MVTRKKAASDKIFFERLGRRVESLILKDREYKSLDAFALEHHDRITKPTLYQLCAGERDMKVSTLRGLASALGISLEELIRDL